MYEELLKELRYLAKVYSICGNTSTKEYKLAVDAADAIEELQKIKDNWVYNTLRHSPTIIPAEYPVMEYPQVEGITPTVINAAEEGE